MVSKIAVAALVAIIAVPILMGYGLNIETENDSRYEATGQDTNVTPLLANSEAYRYVTADAYSLNSANYFTDYPLYVKFSNAYSSMYFYQIYNQNWNGLMDYDVQWYTYIYVETNAVNLDASIVDNGNTIVLHGVTVISFDKNLDNRLHVIFSGDEWTFAPNSTISTYPGSGYVPGERLKMDLPTSMVNNPQEAVTSSRFVDISAGCYVPSNFATRLNSLPAPASEVVLTLDLSSGHDMYIRTYSHLINLENKTTHWDVITVNDGETEYEKVCELPIDGSNSSYQFILNKPDFTINYVGSWPNDIGLANAYRTWGPFPAKQYNSDLDTRYVTIGVINPPYDTNSPIYRVDLAKLRSVTYSVISDKTYDPAGIVPSNPATTINGVYETGTSIGFGGNTYAASKGNIRVGTHDISLQGCVFDSVFNGTGYDNRINGTVISTTPTPSTISFNGQWGIASVSTVSLAETIVNVQKWVPGDFAWDGIDTNFKLAGLLASLGAFIGLAIYGRRSGSNVLPLLLICGGAAFMFLLMI